MIEKIQKNLSKNLLLYTFVVIVLGFTASYYFDTRSLSKFLLPIVIVMIYPMMVSISISSLKKISGSMKPLIEGLILNFIYAPVIMYLLSSLFISDPQIKLALMFLSIAPASSMGLGYIGLAEGNMVTGTIMVASAFVLSIFVYPVLGPYFAAGANISVPASLMLKNLFLILILPLFLGIITREYIERKFEKGTFKKIKPWFSTITLIFLYLLLFIIFALKAKLIMKNYIEISHIAPVAILFYGVTILLTLFVNKKILNIEYGNHQAVVFTSISKNVALTIAILIAVFDKAGQYMAVIPAIISMFQAPFLMVYLKLSGRVRHYFQENPAK